jgi:hypothetical protein
MPRHKVLDQDRFEAAEESDDVSDLNVVGGLPDMRIADVLGFGRVSCLVPHSRQIGNRSAGSGVFVPDWRQALDVKVAHSAPNSPSVNSTNVAGPHA